ncbi:hypothetical protein [Ekhidna sp.]|uniref:hypothetical protein n=1 Tax=Ekhidna sp. TaxID=2608089 RepID=UPI003B5017F9
MKRKIFTLVVLVIGALSFTACQEDLAMEELVEDIEMNADVTAGTDGDDDDDGNPAGS